MKGQAEIIGVAMVAVLAIGLTLILSPRLEQVSFQEENEVQALTTILRTTVDCDGARMQLSDLLRGCVREDCSCRNMAMLMLLEGSADGRKYDFEILKNGNIDHSEKTGDCTKTSIWLPSEEVIEVRLGIC
jgi:hypothetical protein